MEIPYLSSDWIRLEMSRNNFSGILKIHQGNIRVFTINFLEMLRPLCQVSLNTSSVAHRWSASAVLLWPSCALSSHRLANIDEGTPGLNNTDTCAWLSPEVRYNLAANEHLVL